MVANKYAFLQITRRRFLNEWEAFKKVISRRNIRRRITIPLTLSNLKLLDESPERKTSFIEISRGGKLPYKTGSPAISVRSEERFSRNAETDIVCRLLLEKKKDSFGLGMTAREVWKESVDVVGVIVPWNFP